MQQRAAADWKTMRSAPRDGTRILVALRASEQGPAEVDVVRWAKLARSAEEGWVATDSDLDARVVYADAELSAWMPLPTPLPKLRSGRVIADAVNPADQEETDGSAI